MWVYCVCVYIYIMLTFSVDCSLNLKLCAQFGGEVKLRSVCVGVGGGMGDGKERIEKIREALNLFFIFYICFKLTSVLKACRRKSRKTVFDCLHRLKMLWKGICSLHHRWREMQTVVQKPFPFHAGQCICLILELNSAKQSGEGINYFKVRPEFVSCVPMVVQGFEWLITYI